MSINEVNFTITSEEAFSLLADVLCIPEPEKKLEVNRVAFFGEFMKAMYHHIPWQTISILSTPPQERHLPTPAEIRNDIPTKIGGLCYTRDVFAIGLQRALGYDVILVPSTFLTNKDSHIVLIAENLTGPGSKHLADVGLSVPSFRPIPLDFEETSPEYQDSYLRYRFVRRGDDVIRQHSFETDPTGYGKDLKDSKEDGWFSYITIHVKRPVDVAHFTPTVGRAYTNVKSGLNILYTIHCCAYPNGRLVYIKNTTFMIQDEEGRVQKSYLRSRDEMVAAFARHFPQIPEKMIQAAIDDENVQLDYTRELS